VVKWGWNVLSMVTATGPSRTSPRSRVGDPETATRHLLDYNDDSRARYLHVITSVTWTCELEDSVKCTRTSDGPDGGATCFTK